MNINADTLKMKINIQFEWHFAFRIHLHFFIIIFSSFLNKFRLAIKKAWTEKHAIKCQFYHTIFRNDNDEVVYQKDTNQHWSSTNATIILTILTVSTVFLSLLILSLMAQKHLLTDIKRKLHSTDGFCRWNYRRWNRDVLNIIHLKF